MLKLFSRIRQAGLSLFLKELINNYGSVGAVFPSSRLLAKAMSDPIPDKIKGYVVELGAGTGAITQALIKKVSHPKQLIIIEQSEKLADYLQQRYPTAQIIHGDAVKLSALLADQKNQIHCIVSSLPLRSMPTELVRAISDEIENLLKPGDLFIQFTYSYTKHLGHHSHKLKRIQHKRIWFNIPPARVDVFEKI